MEIYGVPVVHETYGDVIINFTSKQTGTGPTPETVRHYNAVATPDGKAIPEGGEKTYIKARGARYATVWIHYYDLEGNELGEKQVFEKASYRSRVGHVYVNNVDPSATPMPGPNPTPDPSDPAPDPGDPAPDPGDPTPDPEDSPTP